jgi:hypothetical protein
MQDRKPYLDTNEVAELINRTPHSVRRLVMRGRIPYRKAGGRLMFPTSEIINWVEGSPGKSVEEVLSGKN